MNLTEEFCGHRREWRIVKISTLDPAQSGIGVEDGDDDKFPPSPQLIAIIYYKAFILFSLTLLSNKLFVFVAFFDSLALTWLIAANPRQSARGGHRHCHWVVDPKPIVRPTPNFGCSNAISVIVGWSSQFFCC